MAELNTINTLFLPLSMEKEVQAHLDIPEGVRSEGWVYVLTNPYMPGIYKIGMTTNEPEFRANQISHGTGIPAPFEVSEAYFSENPKQDEQDIHEYLSDFRINQSREFFQCSEEDVEEAFSAAGLVRRTSSAEELADRFNVVCFETEKRFSLEEMFDDLDLHVFGCKFAATKRLVEIAKSYIDHFQRLGCSIVFMNGRAIPILTEFEQQRSAHIKACNAAGAYGPQKPLEF